VIIQNHREQVWKMCSPNWKEVLMGYVKAVSHYGKPQYGCVFRPEFESRTSWAQSGGADHSTVIFISYCLGT